jgi:membrane associated rhomboid family serine protease
MLMTKIVKNLLIINILVFLATIVLDHLKLNIANSFVLYPFTDERFSSFQLITYMFLHGSFTHILFNMLALAFIGPFVESEFGSKKFLLFYFISGIIGGLLQVYFFNMPCIGASAAVWGIITTYAVIKPNERLYLYFIIPVRAKYIVGFLFFLEVMALWTPSDGIGHLAHIGGAVSGVLFYLISKKDFAFDK